MLVNCPFDLTHESGSIIEKTEISKQTFIYEKCLNESKQEFIEECKKQYEDFSVIIQIKEYDKCKNDYDQFLKNEQEEIKKYIEYRNPNAVKNITPFIKDAGMSMKEREIQDQIKKFEKCKNKYDKNKEHVELLKKLDKLVKLKDDKKNINQTLEYLKFNSTSNLF